MKNKPVLKVLLFLVIAVVIGVISAFLQFLVISPNRSYAYANVEFLYDGASDGLDPNGEKINPVDFITLEIIKDGLKEAGFDDKYDVEIVASNLSVTAYVPKNIIKQITSYDSLVKSNGATKEVAKESYYSTKYSFMLYNDFDKKLSKNDVNKILNGIINSYTKYFCDYYKKAYDLTNYDDALSVGAEDDYIYIIQSYRIKFNLIDTYANSLYEQEPDFVASNNLSFKDVSLKAASASDNDITKINYLISYKALTKDTDRLEDFYDYKIKDLNNNKIKYQKDLTAINSILATYKKDSTIYISSGENIIKVDSNSIETYNSLLEQKIALSESIAKVDSQINDYTQRKNDITTHVATDADYAYLQNEIDKMVVNYDNLEETFLEMLSEYNKENIETSLVSATSSKFSSNSIASSAFVVRLIKACGPIGCVAVLGICAVFFVKGVKKNKEELV